LIPVNEIAGSEETVTTAPVFAAPKTRRTAPAAGRQRLPRTSGPVVTARDRAILQWIGRHGIVTRQQVTQRFFGESRDSGRWAAYRRIHKLIQMGLLQEDHTFYRQPMVLRVTNTGARFVHLDVRAARLVLAEVPHALAVVDLLDQLLADLPEDTVLVTEREIRAERRRDLRLDPNKAGQGRMPDAELQVRGRRIAVELDLSAKRSRVYEELLSSYLQQEYDEVLWYVLPGVVTRLRGIVMRNQADDFVHVRPWEA